MRLGKTQEGYERLEEARRGTDSLGEASRVWESFHLGQSQQISRHTALNSTSKLMYRGDTQMHPKQNTLQNYMNITTSLANAARKHQPENECAL